MTPFNSTVVDLDVLYGDASGYVVLHGPRLPVEVH